MAWRHDQWEKVVGYNIKTTTITASATMAAAVCARPRGQFGGGGPCVEEMDEESMTEMGRLAVG